MLFCGFLIDSPKFLTPINCPSSTKDIVPNGINSERTPVILISTFLLRSPSSYPKAVSLDLIFEAIGIKLLIPEHPKN